MLEGKLAGQYHEFAQTRETARLGREEQLKKLQAAIPPQTALVDVLEYRHSLAAVSEKGAIRNSSSGWSRSWSETMPTRRRRGR